MSKRIILASVFVVALLGGGYVWFWMHARGYS
jgi:hypothetical protein